MKIRILRGGPCVTNCFIVKDDETHKAIIIDPAFNPSRIIKESSGYEIEYIIITHAHIDHLMALDELKKVTNARIVISNQENASLNDAHLNLSDLMEIPSVTSKADITVNDGDTLPFANTEIKFILTPGHTAGSMCVFVDDVIFSGDTLFNRTIGRCDLPGGCYDELIKSIKEKLFVYPENTTVYPGHGPRTSIGIEKRENPFVV